MQSVKVNVRELLEIIKFNRDRHRAIFEKAMAAYRQAAIAELDAAIDDARSGKKIRRSLTLIEPEDYTREYERVIAMLEMTIDEVVEISARDFAKYVRDEWEWKEQFIFSNSSYVGGIRDE